MGTQWASVKRRKGQGSRLTRSIGMRVVLRGLIFKVFLDSGAVDDLLVDLRTLHELAERNFPGTSSSALVAASGYQRQQGARRASLEGAGGR